MSAEERTVRVIKADKSSENSTLRVAAYCRVSTSEEDQLNSFITQMHYYHDFISQSDNMVLVDIYADEGITGTSVEKRNEFKRMLNDCRLGKIDRIYVKSVSRFARNALECIESIRLLREYGVSVFFENDRIDTLTLNSELILYVKSAFAQSEALATSKRVSTANRMRLEIGEYSICSAPYGFRAKNNELFTVPEEAAIVREVYGMYLSGMGFLKIAQALNRKYGTEKRFWKVNSILYILSNEKYAGDALFQKRFTPPVLPLMKRKNKGELPKYYVQNTHEAIIDKETFNLVQEKLKENTERTAKSKSRNNIFAGKLYCAYCSRSFKIKYVNGESYYACSKNKVSEEKCLSHSMSEEVIGRTFIRFYNKLRQNENVLLKDIAAKLTETRRIITCSDSLISEIDKEISVLSEKLNLYISLQKESCMDAVTFSEQCSKLESSLLKLKSRRKKVLAEDGDEKCIDELRRLIRFLDTEPKAIIVFSRPLFDELIDKAYFEDEYVTFYLKCSLAFKERIAWN